jgi:sterol 14-demethylase
MTPRIPPSLPGIPLLGHIFDYRRDHLNVFWKSYRALGPVFSLRLGSQRMAVMIGSDAHHFFFTQVDKILSLPEVNRFVVPMFGKVLNASDDYQVRRKHLALLHSAFHPRRMEKHIKTMVGETIRWLDQLSEQGEIELYESFSSLAMRIAASSLMGSEIRQRLNEFIPLFHDLARGMDFVLPPNLPLPRFRRRDRARNKLHDLVTPIILRRQAESNSHDDFFQVIVDGNYLNASSADGNAELSETIVGLTLMTVFTAYIATAAQTCWSLIQLLQNPSFLAKVIEEQYSVLGASPSETICVETLTRLKHLDWSLKESQRMHPVMTHYARYNVQGYQFQDFDIPQGWFTVVCPAISHRDPNIFSNPDMYDPYRFSPGREEHSRSPYSLIGFGAGVYRCPGATFGINEMKTVISLLLSRYRLELATPDVRPDFEMGVVRPRPPCRLIYRRRNDRIGAACTDFTDPDLERSA